MADLVKEQSSPPSEVSFELCHVNYYNQSLLISNPITILNLEFSPIRPSVNIQITQSRYKFLIT